MLKSGYKVVRLVGKTNRRGYMPATEMGVQSMRYFIGQLTTRGNNGPLAVFSEMDQAVKFKISMEWFDWLNDVKRYPFAILQVEYHPSRERRFWRKVCAYTHRHAFECHIGQRIDEKTNRLIMWRGWPEGVHFADSVYVLGEVLSLPMEEL